MNPLKLFSILTLCLFFVSMVSAADWDNKLDYSNQDLTATFSNSFLGIFETSQIGSATLKSHQSIAQVLEVAPGKNRVVMFYDFDFSQEYENGLGTVEFKDMRSGNQIEKPYHFVIWGTKTIQVPDYETICHQVTNQTNQTEICEQIQTGTHEEEVEDWLDFDTANIPQGKARIGLMTDVNPNEYVDGVWTIVGKKVGKHASWTANLNTGLNSYYKLDEQDTTGVGVIIDSVGNYNGTNAGASNTSGKINTAYSFDGGSDDRINLDNNPAQNDTMGSFSAWIYSNSVGSIATIIGHTGDSTYMKLDTLSSPAGQLRFFTSDNVYNLRSTLQISTGKWYHIVLTNNGTETKLYINGTEDTLTNTGTGGDNDLWFDYVDETYFSLGLLKRTSPTQEWNGKIDEVGIWNRTLTPAEVTQLYNNGTGISWQQLGGNLTILYPTATTYSTQVTQLNYTNSTDMDKCWYSTDGGATNSSPIVCGSANFTGLASTEGSNTWTLYGNTTTGDNVSTSVTFTQDTTPNIQYENPTPANASNLTYTYLPINVSLTETYFQNVTFNFYLEGSLNESQTFTNSTRFYNATNLTEGNWIVNVTTCTTFSSCNTTERRYYLLDISPPVFNGTSPMGTYDLLVNNQTLDVNWTIIDEGVGVDSCWFIYNGVRTDVNCTDNHSQIYYVPDVNNMTGYANDTLGQEINVTLNWSYNLLEINQTYLTEVTDGASTSFSANIGVNPSLRISQVFLVWNGTANNAAFTETSSDHYIISETIVVPNVINDTNITFYWNVTFDDDSSVQTTSYNQTVIDFDIDNCSSYNFTLFNFTVVDEDSQSQLDGSTQNVSGEVDFNITNINTGEQVIHFYKLYNYTNPFALCSNVELSEASYRIDGVVEYSSLNRFVEFYNIQNYTLNNATDSQNITLYDLNSSKGQEFKVTYKDANFNLVPGAVIQVQRKYISEGLFKTIEIPLIGSDGSTITHMIKNDVIYNLIVLQDGTVLDSFNNVIASCQNPSFTDCEININSYSSGINPEDFSTDGTFTSILQYNRTTKVISTTFAIASGVPATTNLNVVKMDAYGNTSVCNDSLYSSGGTLSCTVPTTFLNSTILVKVNSGGDQKRYAIISLNSDPNTIYGHNIIFLSIMIIMFLIGMAITDNPMVLAIVLGFGTVFLVGLNLIVNTGWIGGTATVLWFIVGLVILLIKGSNRQ